MVGNWIRFFRTDDTRIETKRLRLRRICRKDRDDMYEYASREEVTRYLLWSPHESPAYTKRLIEHLTGLYRTGGFFDFAIEYRENGKMIGTCGFAAVDEKNNSAEVGYVLSPDYWGMGIACEAVNAVLQFGFCDLGLRRIEARYMVENTASRRVMEKCGMTFEGIYRQKILVREKYRDVGICSILDDEYFAKNANKSALCKRTLGFFAIKTDK